jgi:hypothetical protein
MPTVAPVSDFLLAREAFKLALARHNNQERRLFALFGVADSSALEAAMLANRSQGLKHAEEIAKFSQLGHALDRAGDQYDLACAAQRRKVAEQQAEFNADIRRLEC